MSVASAVEHRITRAPVDGFIRVRDIPGTSGAVDTAMTRAVRRHPDVTRVRKGLYWKGTRTRFGVTRPSDLQVALEAAGPGSGPSGWSALAAIGATTQVPASASVSTLKPTTGLRAKTEKRSNLERVSLTALEVACLEAARAEWAARADLDVPARVAQLAREGKVRPAALRRAARGETRQVAALIGEALG